jgi:hypothetical protein
VPPLRLRLVEGHTSRQLDSAMDFGVSRSNARRVSSPQQEVEW